MPRPGRRAPQASADTCAGSIARSGAIVRPFNWKTLAALALRIQLPRTADRATGSARNTTSGRRHRRQTG